MTRLEVYSNALIVAFISSFAITSTTYAIFEEVSLSSFALSVALCAIAGPFLVFCKWLKINQNEKQWLRQEGSESCLVTITIELAGKKYETEVLTPSRQLANDLLLSAKNNRPPDKIFLGLAEIGCKEINPLINWTTKYDYRNVLLPKREKVEEEKK